MVKKTETRPSTANINPFGLRMQSELRARLESAAEDAGRSLNAEIVSRLEQSFVDAILAPTADNDLSQYQRGYQQALYKIIEARLAELDAEIEFDGLASETALATDRLHAIYLKLKRQDDTVRNTLDTLLVRLRMAWRLVHQVRRAKSAASPE